MHTLARRMRSLQCTYAHMGLGLNGAIYAASRRPLAIPLRSFFLPEGLFS